MVGRFRRDGCGNFKCRLCGPNGDEIKRWRKRVEARAVADEIEGEYCEYVAVSSDRGRGVAGWHLATGGREPES